MYNSDILITAKNFILRLADMFITWAKLYSDFFIEIGIAAFTIAKKKLTFI